MGNVSARVAAICPSATLGLNARAAEMKRQGVDVISFAVGEPDFDTPENVKEAAKKAIDGGFTKYMPTAGIPDLRQAIRAKFKRDNGLEYESSQVMVCAGAKQALFNAVMALFGPGDEVIVPAPYWVTYPEQVKLAGAEPVPVSTPPETGFRLTADLLRQHIAPRTRGIILNDPSNPSGAVYEADELRALGEVCREAGMWVISDEVYEVLVYDGRRHHSLPAVLPAMYERTVVINALSKSHAMTGWRLGYAAGPLEVIKGMSSLQDHVTGNATSITQMAAVEALNGPQDSVRRMVAEFEVRRDLMVEGLNRLPGISCRPPAGAFYAFADVRGALGRRVGGREVTSDAELAEVFLTEAHVAAVPGSAFGYPGFVRFSFATSREKIQEGISRLARLLG